MRTIGIIGLGHTGILLANLLVAREAVDQLVLIDQDDQRTNAVAADLTDALPASQPQIIQQDYAALKQADIVIISAGDARKLTAGRFAELSANAEMIKTSAKRLRQSGFNGVLLNLSNPNEATTALWQQALEFSPRQVIGTGTILDTQRARLAVARQAHLHPSAVDGFIIGQHDGRLVFPWSTWNVNGQSMPAAVNGHQLDQHQLAIKSRESSWITVSGLGYDASGICFAALRTIEAVMTDSGQALPVAVYHPQFKTYLSYPVAVGRQGSGIFNLLQLLPVEEEQLAVAATAISDQVASQQ
ncbi:NAD-binding protein [uncultured Limosilactobacillus sp.]|uniref:lactate/malate family dehydrogenase n=1 Tax=uncultured Limosilactobacillus sp. TaxID=2837629 RepID=UPI0025DAC051|nr:NAD-binding protein [uncultured Limosilactobacillus sp.]